MSRPNLVLVLCAIGAFLATPITHSFQLMPATAVTSLPKPQYSRVDLEGIVRQTTDKTCGPAALTTLLVQYFHESVTETEMYEAAIRSMIGDGYVNHGWPIVTFRGLIGALDSLGYRGYALHMDAEGVGRYLDEHHIPLVLQIFHPTAHFTVLLGRVGDLFVLADSVVGQFVLTETELMGHWSGYAIAVRPPLDRAFDHLRLVQRLEEVSQRIGHLSMARQWL